MTRSSISVSASRARFEAAALALARERGADLVFSAPGCPARTEPVVGVDPVAELVFDEGTTPDDIREFCFGTPGPALGFISYSYGMLLRGVASAKARRFPLGHLKKYAARVEFDADGERALVFSADPALRGELAARIEAAPEHTAVEPVRGLPRRAPESSLGRAGYEAGVRETLARIRGGHTYQLNLSTRFSWTCPDLDPLALWASLWRRHPAPFYAWFSSGGHRVLSTSPERFLRVADGRVLSQPIKGTLRFDAPAPGLAERLTGSAKEAAELSMIVDLIRNDISAHCAYGSVRVENHKSVFAVDNLLQMYADVRGELRPGSDCLDLFLDAFPGGSVTGCPKRRSMEIIEELEPHARELFCGSMVVVRDERTLDSSIAIRTALFDAASGRLDVYAGSGIVVDSVPASEYEETLAKAEKFLDAAKIFDTEAT
ncbi:chorismate-binding protein [Pseudodesulfovibrio sp.]|uniref:chorismate-binding protein n=1 Tax=Pseudodesulfovibrio sp. TaxID=2035812 RepID=UPI0026082A62|nr:chorismate-binding protein [Pseudodesulfovibrio sp.]MDD3312077.1 chorismate-binding protein [Pseudodesulfovibrio sp.]